MKTEDGVGRNTAQVTHTTAGEADPEGLYCDAYKTLKSTLSYERHPKLRRRNRGTLLGTQTFAGAHIESSAWLAIRLRAQR